MDPYRKELVYTITFTLLLLLMGHSGLIFAMFPSLQGHMIFGFPSHYIIPITLAWLGLMVVVIIQAKIGNQLDEEIEQANELGRKANSNNSSIPMSGGGQ